MIVQKKQVGTRKDSKGNDKPVYAPDITDDQREKYRVKFDRKEDHYVLIPRNEVEDQLQAIRQESEQRTNSVIEEIAKIVEEADFSKQGIGQELGQKMRELNQRKP